MSRQEYCTYSTETQTFRQAGRCPGRNTVHTLQRHRHSDRKVDVQAGILYSTEIQEGRYMYRQNYCAVQGHKHSDRQVDVQVGSGRNPVQYRDLDIQTGVDVQVGILCSTRIQTFRQAGRCTGRNTVYYSYTDIQTGR
jgi:hypothetical protein